MNRYFSPEPMLQWDRPPVPRQAYGNVESVRINAEKGIATIRLHLIDGDWLMQRRSDPLFSLDDPDGIEKSWINWLTGPVGRRADPMAAVPLSTLEADTPFDLIRWAKALRLHGQFNDDDDRVDAVIGAIHKLWFLVRFNDLSLMARGGTGMLYQSIVDAGVPVAFAAKTVVGKTAKALTNLSSISGCTVPSSSDLQSFVASARADYLGAFDVGQANAVALCNVERSQQRPRAVWPSLYVDTGLPIQSQLHTASMPITLCFDRSPNVILTHWHDDHVSAYRCVPAGSLSGLDVDWIVPDGGVTVHQKAIVTSIIGNGRKVYRFAAGQTLTAGLHSHHTITLVRGNGSQPNTHGIVAQVTQVPQVGTAPPYRSWLIAGDCDYRYMPPGLLTADLAAVVVPHHGGNLKGSGSSGAPAASMTSPYKRLVYSFGHGNSYGHPTAACYSAHHLSGWLHPPGAPPLTSSASGNDVLITAVVGGPTRVSGALVGWHHPPKHHFTKCVLPLGAAPQYGCTTCSCALHQI